MQDTLREFNYFITDEIAKELFEGRLVNDRLRDLRLIHHMILEFQNKGGGFEV